MNCPSCSVEMEPMTMAGHMGRPVELDLCASCHAFWFDKHESLTLSPASVLQLMKFIGDRSCSTKAAALPDHLRCPRCSLRLKATKDMQRNTRFSYFRCTADHGRFITFFEFLREKDFIRPLSPKQIEDLRRNVQILNCSNCGAPIELASESACSHCGSLLSMLDMRQPQELLRQLGQESLRPASTHPLAKIDAVLEYEKDMWRDTPVPDLVQAGLSAVARWLAKSGLL